MANPKLPDAQFKLRLPIELKDQVEKSASDSKRSINAEIIARIERSYELQRQVDYLRTKSDAEEEENFRLKSQMKTMQSSEDSAALAIAKQTIDTLEKMVEDARRTLRADHYMLAQVRLMRHLLDQVAMSNGKPSDDLLGVIRMLSNDAETRESSALLDLLRDASDAIQALEDHGEWQN